MLKQLDYMMIFSFDLVCLTFSISYTVLPFHLVYVLQCLYFFSFLVMFLCKPLSSVVEKFFMHVYNIYFRILLNFCLTKKVVTFLFHQFDLV